MKEAVIKRVNGTVDWEQIPCIDINEPLRGKATEVKAHAQICYDDNALYLRLTAFEKYIRAEENGPLGMPCEDSCLEFFFSPNEGDWRYLNLEFNPNCCLYIGMGSGPHDLVRFVFEDESVPGVSFCPKVEYTEDGWNITYQMPYSFIRRYFPDFKAFSGKNMRANFYKCADLGETPHHLQWNPITRTGVSVFHTPQEFGTLHFE